MVQTAEIARGRGESRCRLHRKSLSALKICRSGFLILTKDSFAPCHAECGDSLLFWRLRLDPAASLYSLPTHSIPSLLSESLHNSGTKESKIQALHLASLFREEKQTMLKIHQKTLAREEYC